MDYNALLAVASDLGYALLESGAEIYRVEEAIQRLLHAYGVQQADPFVIPNCIIVSFVTPEGQIMTQVRRVSSHGTDVDLLERYYDLGRRLCREVPPLSQAKAALIDIGQTRRTYPLPLLLLAYFVGTSAFCRFFGGTWQDAFCSGLCGISIGLSLNALTQLHANLFLKTILSAALSAFLALSFTFSGMGEHSELITIGALMALVPGIVFTNAIRDVMAGDMVAGLSKITDALLTGVAIALGTGFAMALFGLLQGGLL